jgi:glycosyltransferase involved in cell wall biosynthesis
VNRLILVGRPLTDFFAQYVDRYDHIRIVANGVRFPSGVRSDPIFGSRSHRLVSVSNLVEGKGVDITLDALASLNRSGVNDWNFTIIGDGADRAALELRARKLGLSDQVFFVGAQSSERVFETLLASDIFVLPSYREAFGIAYLEAMACGLVTIGVRGQGPEAFIEHGRSGFLVEPRDPRAVSDCLRHIFLNHASALEVTENAKRRAQHFSWDAHANNLKSVFSEVLESRVG